MGAKSELGLMDKQMVQINACQMYLKVTTIAKIVDHTGMTLLPHALGCNKVGIPKGLNTISTSTPAVASDVQTIKGPGLPPNATFSRAHPVV